jgi:hypothetical protein
MRKTIAALIVLSACSNGAPTEPQTHADFVPNSNAIEVVVNDPRPVHSIRLISPDGDVISAADIHTERTVYPGYSPGPSLGLGFGGFSSSGGGGGFGSGVGFGLPLGGGEPAAARSITTATISLPDPAAYRQNWQRYHIEVQIGDPQSILMLDAPQPPA